MFRALRGWTGAQKHAVAASYLGWTLDAFDFFLLTFVVTDIARTFDVDVKFATVAIFVTLALRPVGAFVFGRFADRYGRRPILMIDVALYALLAFASGFAPSLIAFLCLRGLFGIAMGGEWGIGASLTMETVPPESRGLVSGLLQTGYSSGYLLAAGVYALLFPQIGWRGLIMLGLAPALLVLYIRRNVPESPGWHPEKKTAGRIVTVLAKHWLLAIYAIFLMAALNFLSHGTQDMYPTFLKVDHGFTPHVVGTIVIVGNIGAILGGLFFGALSQRFGRRRTLVTGALLCLPAIPVWLNSDGAIALAIGAFAMQFMVQGCWGIIPAHLNELSPPVARGTFPGTVYQLGNLIASYTAPLQAGLAVTLGTYGLALGVVAGAAAGAVAFLTLAAMLVAFFTGAGLEARDRELQVTHLSG